MRTHSIALQGALGRLAGAAGIALIALGCLACASLDLLNRRSDFEETQKRFTQYVRWGKFEKASEFVEPELRGEFLALAPELSEIRFTDYEILNMEISDGLRRATVDVRYSGYLLSMPVERSVHLTQEWNRDEQSGRWQVRLELAKIRDALGSAKR